MKLRQGVWILCFIALAAEASDAISPKRVVELDEKALWAKKSAAHALANVARKSAGTSREPSLLLRLAEMNEDIASIQYRLAFAKAPGRSGADLSGYTTSLNMALAPLNRLITQYPGWTGIPRAYYLRSKALEETGRTAAAIEDLKRLVQTWPASGDAPVANMELWRLLIQQKDYAVAIQYINRYGLRPSDKHYHAVLEKLSWCHFYLGMMAEALRYTEVELRTARGVEREKALSNYALFYATGLERKITGVDSASALTRFREVTFPQELPGLVVSFAYLLRSKGLDPHLDVLKKSILSEKVSDALKSDIFVIALENQFNRGQFAEMKASAEQEISLFASSKVIREDAKRTSKIKASFNEIIPGLQKQLAGSPAPQRPIIASTLRIFYQFMLETSGRDVFEQARIHFNMGEVSFELKEYELAVEHYRWVVQHLDVGKKEHQELFLLSSVKSLDARYAVIKEKDWALKTLVAKSFSSPKREVPAPVLQWVEWIDAFPKNLFIAKKVDAHAFEANRILYSFDHIEKATQRLAEFAVQYPASAFAVSSASLVLDTYIASERWEEAYELAHKYLTVQEWKTSDFHVRLGALAADVYCKVLDRTYREKKFDVTIKNADAFVRANPATKRKGEMLELAANAALALGDRVRAAEFFRQLLDAGVRKPEVTALALMTQGSLAEERFDFGEAARSYRSVVASSGKSPEKSSDELREKILLLSWLSGDSRELNASLRSESVCGPESTIKICSLYGKRYLETYGSHAEVSKKGSETPIIRMSGGEKVANQRMSEFLADVSAEWLQLDSLERSTVLPMLTNRIPEFFSVLRQQVRKASPLKLGGPSIAKRTRLIARAQEIADKLAGMPSLKIRLGLLRESTLLYEEASQDVLSIRPPAAVKGDALGEFKQALAEGASAFSQKAEELRKSERELASRRGAEASPEQAKRWSELLLEKANPGTGAAWFAPFKLALEKQNWPFAAFVIGRAADGALDKNGKISDDSLSFLRAAFLARTGATAEALEELKRLPSQIESEVANGRSLASEKSGKRELHEKK